MQLNKITLIVIALIAIGSISNVARVASIAIAPAADDADGLQAEMEAEYLDVENIHSASNISGGNMQHMALTTTKQTQAAATTDNNENDTASGVAKKATTTTEIKKTAPKNLPAFLFNGDLRKIHSNSKSIAGDSSRHFFFERNFENVVESASASESESAPDQSTAKMRAKKKKHPKNKTDVMNVDAGDSKVLAKEKKQHQRELSLIRRLFKQLKGKKVRGAKKKHLKRPKKHLMPHTRSSMHVDGLLEPHRNRRAVIAKTNRLWEHAIIPYEIEEDLFGGSHKALFKQAMRHYENHTCIKFVERDPKLHENFIFFTIQSCGCCSPVGRQSGRQNISIGHGCEKFGIIVHELGHAIGFLHEHTRTDRDKYISIKKTNILKGQEYNFEEKEDVDSLGLPYDYNSIMHYAKNTFSKSVYLDTIQPIGDVDMDRADMGQRVRLSSGDIAKANLLYKCPKCGKTFQQSAGQITAPHYLYAGGSSGGDDGSGDGDLSADAFEKSWEQCEWRITATRGERIILQVHQLNLLMSENCEVDYLEVRDGYWHESPIKRRICGNMTAETIKSDSSRMLINYVNHNANKGYRGFIADYEVTCGGDIYLDEVNRYIDSPTQLSAGEPTYGPDKDCVWIVHVSGNHQVGLNFLSFELENHDNCIYDYVEIRDGNSSDSELIGVFCGDRLPPNIKTNSNQMYVKFVSDGSVQKVGFSALFLQELDECKFSNHSCEHKCINTLGSYQCACYAGYELEANGRTCKDACGGIIDASTPNGTLYSPSYPDVYPARKECVWEVVAPPNHAVFLNFTHFNLEGTKFQCFDYLVVYSKLEDSSLKKIGMFCGNQLPPIVNSQQNVLRLEFYSDKSVQRTGFAARIQIDTDECKFNNGGCQHHCRNTFGAYKCSCRKGYTLQEDRHSCMETKCKFEITKSLGIIYSPNYPDDYPRNSYCFWHFQTVLGHRVRLTFLDFNVESHQECIYDYVAIYDGRSENASSLGVYCSGQEPPKAVIASTNEMFMLLKTDYGLQRKGFMVSYATECGSYLRATNQTQYFYSHPLYGSHNYKRNLYCNWRIQSDAESSVRIEFLHFEIENSERCDYDFVEVTEELTLTRNINNNHGRFCGNKKPLPIISYSDTLLVRFQTDESTSLLGFVISFVAVEPPDDEMIEMDAVTPFPGYMKNMYYASDSDYDDSRAALPLLHFSGARA